MSNPIRPRGGTAAERAASMPVLAAREIAVSTDDGNIYVGDGVTAGGKLAGRSTFVQAGSTAPSNTDGYWLSTSMEHMTVSAAPGDKSVIFGPTGNPQESNVWHYNNAYHILFTYSGAINYSTCLDSADPTKAASWSAPVRVIGSGDGGFATGCGRSGLLIDGTSLYLYFHDLAAEAAIYVATANIATPTSWTTQASPVYNLPSGGGRFGNCCPVKDGSTYRLFVDVLYGLTYHGDSRQDWLATQATSTTPTGMFTQVTWSGRGYLDSLRPPDSAGGKGAGFVGQITKEGSTWVAVFHAGEQFNVPPNDIYRASTTDLATDAWVLDPEPLISRTHPIYEVDQVADPSFVRGPGGVTYVFWEGYNNGASQSWLMVSKMQPRQMLHDGRAWVPASPTSQAAPVQAVPDLIEISQPWCSWAARSGTWAYDSTTTFGPRYYGSGDGSWIAFDVLLRPGTWSLRICTGLGSGNGIVDIHLSSSNGGSNTIFTLPALATIDGYAAAASNNIPAPIEFKIYGSRLQLRRLRFMTNGKNASSSSYYQQLQGISLVRTGPA